MPGGVPRDHAHARGRTRPRDPDAPGLLHDAAQRAAVDDEGQRRRLAHRDPHAAHRGGCARAAPSCPRRTGPRTRSARPAVSPRRPPGTRRRASSPVARCAVPHEAMRRRQRSAADERARDPAAVPLDPDRGPSPARSARSRCPACPFGRRRSARTPPASTETSPRTRLTVSGYRAARTETRCRARRDHDVVGPVRERRAVDRHRMHARARPDAIDHRRQNTPGRVQRSRRVTFAGAESRYVRLAVSAWPSPFGLIARARRPPVESRAAPPRRRPGARPLRARGSGRHRPAIRAGWLAAPLPRPVDGSTRPCSARDLGCPLALAIVTVHGCACERRARNRTDASAGSAVDRRSSGHRALSPSAAIEPSFA